MGKTPNLDNVKDPFEGEEQSPEPETPPAPTPEAVQAENERLRAEVETLKRVRVEVAPAPAPAQPAAPAMTPEQLQAQAEALGFTDPKQVESIAKIAAHVAAPAHQKAELLERQLAMERTVTRVKKEAQAADPQFSKLEPFVDEYLDNISTEDKSDPEKLRKHVETAKYYARGKMGAAAPAAPRKAPIRPTNDSPADPADEEGKVFDKPETYETRDGKTRLTVVPRVSPAVRKMHAHPDIEGAVQIDAREEWKGAKFASKPE